MHALNFDGEFSGDGSRLPAWGDLGNGLYKNPVLNADYSDPDVIRVGNDFYMVCSDFHFMGMPVLHSRDLVSWTIVSHVYKRLDIAPHYSEMAAYGKGSWAPSIRYHNGFFHVYFCTPDEGLYMSTAKEAAGPWSPLHEIKRVYGWEDPCPFWDDDGNAYLGHSILGAGPIIVHRMSTDGRELLDEGRTVYIGKIAEGTKIYKRNGWYYLLIPEGGVEKGWQAALRSRDIYGPYERRIVLETGRGVVNGPHQGGLVELESGESWFMHFQSAGALGRVCHLQPVRWVDDWPAIGTSGEPVSVFVKPDVGGVFERTLPQSFDDFSGTTIGLQWQWNHNPVDSAWSIRARPGWLRLSALPLANPPQAKLNSGAIIPDPPRPSVKFSRNMLTQKIMGVRGIATLSLDWSGLSDGQYAGLCLFGGGVTENRIAVAVEDGSARVEVLTSGLRCHGPVLGHTAAHSHGRKLAARGLETGKNPDSDHRVWLRVSLDFDGHTRFSFSLDGKSFVEIGGDCDPKEGYWKGARIGLFCFDANIRTGDDPSPEAAATRGEKVEGAGNGASAGAGFADFSEFEYLHEGMVSCNG